METIILLIFFILSAVVTVQRLRELRYTADWKTTSVLNNIVRHCIVVPVIEEVIFRHGLKLALIDYEYGKAVNIVLFGLMHLTNMSIHLHWYSLIFQIVMATYLGYYLYDFEYISYAMMVHMMYNFGLTMVHYVYSYLSHTECKYQMKDDFGDRCKWSYIDIEIIC